MRYRFAYGLETTFQGCLRKYDGLRSRDAFNPYIVRSTRKTALNKRTQDRAMTARFAERKLSLSRATAKQRVVLYNCASAPSLEERQMSLRIARLQVAVSLVICVISFAGPANAAPATYERLAQASGSSPPMTPSEEEAKRRLESAGYTDVTNVKAGSEILSAKGVKDGKKFDIIIDTFGNIIATPAQ